MHTSPPIATQLTPVGTGAIGVVRITAENASTAQELLSHLTAGRATSLSAGGIVRATFRDAAGDPFDDGLIIRTSETQWELHIHGGIAVMTALLNLLKERGVSVVPADRAQTSETIDALLAHARTMTAVRLLLSQSAARTAWVTEWTARLQTASSGDLWRFHSACQWIMQRSQTLMHLLNPPRIAIIGPPNAGKSTLANALLGRPAAITSDIAGTTRDWVDGEAVLVADAVELAVTLVDTAGIRVTADPLESSSIERTHEQAGQADLILALFDGTRIPTADELRLASARPNQPVIVAINKTDMISTIPEPLRALNHIRLSAKTGDGLNDLNREILSALDLATLSPYELLLAPSQQSLFETLSHEDSPAACNQMLEQLIAQ